MAEDKCDQGCQLIIHNSRRRDKWAACTLPINHSLSPGAASSLKKESLLSSYFFKKNIFIYLSWLHWVLVLALKIFSCSK